jgi:hypothetical protein
LTLSDAAGNELARETISIQDGLQKVEVSIPVPAGQDMQIGFEDGADLFRSNANISYPYEIGGVVSITSSTAGTDPDGSIITYITGKLRLQITVKVNV